MRTSKKVHMKYRNERTMEAVSRDPLEEKGGGLLQTKQDML